MQEEEAKEEKNEKEKAQFNIDESFERKILANLIYEDDFLNRLINVIKPEYFSTPEHQYLAKQIIKHHKKYSVAPTKDSFMIYTMEDHDRNDEHEERQLRNIIQAFLPLFNKDFYKNYLKDREHIQDEAVRFCWQEEMKNAILDCSQWANQNQFHKILNRVELAFHSTDARDEGLDYDDIEGRMDEDFRDSIMPFPWEAINKRIGGGIGDREFMVAIGPMGSGKSLIAINLALHARRIGYNAVLFSLELDKKYVRHRSDVVLTQHTSEDLINMKKLEPEKYKKLLASKMEGFSPDGKLRVVNITAGSTVADLKQSLKLLKAEGFDPDFFVVDYMDLMEPVDPLDKAKKDWGKFEIITRECRDMISRPLAIKGFGLMQGNTGSIKQKIITAENTSGGARRLHPADAVFGYARNNEDKQYGKANWSFIKNRFGPDGFALPVNTDYTVGKIEVMDEEVYVSEDDERKDNIDVKQRLRASANDYIEKFKNPALRDLDEILEQ